MVAFSGNYTDDGERSVRTLLHGSIYVYTHYTYVYTCTYLHMNIHM